MMRFRLLGPVEIREGESWRAIGAPKWRSLLAVLLINANQVVSVDTLIDELWGESVPAKAGNLVSIYVLRLRRMIGDSDGKVLVTRSPGYLLRTGDDGTDVQVFEAKTRDGRRALTKGAPDDAARHLAEALGLWRGTPLADVPRSAIVGAEAERLAELRLDTAELRITAELACGGHAQVVPELRRLLADNPLREGLWLLLMQALDGSGRHAEALDAYGQARAQISDELGVDPGPELRRLYARLLSADTDAAEDDGPPGEIIAGSLAQPALSAESGGQAAASSRTATQRPAQLPTDIADFTGREEQVRHLSDTLAAAPDGDSGAVRIALVAGYGGLGKTSLAIHAAHRVRSQFPDGQLYVDLLGATPHPLPPGDVLGRFLRDLGIDGRDIPVDEAERAARFRTALAGRQVLIVLDNARDAAQVRSLLPGSASCAVLITTRSRMPDLASIRLVDLNVLDDADALTLFTKVVGDKRAAAEPEATAELLDACGGLPLAIRICASRLATRPSWTIRTMANRLRDEHRRLDELAVGDLAVRASFEVSFATLPARKRGVAPARAFCLLGLWQGPTISCAAAAALFGASDDDAMDALELLVDANLLECVAPDRYKFHDLLRVYAAERAVADVPEEDRSAAVVRLLTWYLHTADAAGTAVAPNRYNIPIEPARPLPSAALSFTGPEDALAWYDSERYNVVAVTRHAANQGLHDIAWRFPPPLWMLFLSRDNWADSIATHQIALTSARAAGNQLGEAWILNNLGAILGFTDGHEAVRHLEQAMALRRELGDRRGEAQSANNLADHLARLGRREEGVRMLHRALELNREIGHRYGEAVVLVNLGDALLGLDRPREALPWLHQAHEVFIEVKDPDGLGFAAHARGRCYLALGRESEAVQSYLEALASHQTSGNRQRQAVTLRYLGRAHAKAGRIDRASESLAQSAAIYHQLGDIEQADAVRAELADLSGDSQ